MADTNEPSMEEILASIRKIISEDGATVQAAEPDEAILDLTEEIPPVAEPAPAAPPLDPVIEMEDSVPEPVAAAPVPEVTPVPELERVESLISDNAAAASMSALGGLASMMRNQANSAPIHSMPLGNGQVTLEGMVLEILRPQLKAWLDQNLPPLVERVVQKEIQKITRDLR